MLKSGLNAQNPSMSVIGIFQQPNPVLRRSKVHSRLERVNSVNLLMHVTLGDMHPNFVCAIRCKATFAYSLEIVQVPHCIKAGNNEHALFQTYAVRSHCAPCGFLPHEMNGIVPLSNAA